MGFESQKMPEYSAALSNLFLPFQFFSKKMKKTLEGDVTLSFIIDISFVEDFSNNFL